MSRCRRWVERGGLAGQIKTFQHVERHQRGDALPVGRAFPEAQAVVGGGDGFIPGAGMGFQVLKFHAAAGFAQHIHDALRDGPVVVGILAFRGD